MEQPSASPPSILVPFNGQPVASTSKAAAPLACTNCRRQKLKCDYSAKIATEAEPVCSRCRRLGKDCTAIPGQRGRRLGSKNKPKGENPASTATSDVDPAQPSVSFTLPSLNAQQHTFPSSDMAMTDVLLPVKAGSTASPHASVSAKSDQQVNLSVEEPVNPLSLLAEASQKPCSPDDDRYPAVRGDHLRINATTPKLGLRVGNDVLQAGLQYVLGSTSAVDRALSASTPTRGDYFAKQPAGFVKRDLGPELDPVDLYLLEAGQLDAFFESYFANENACAPILDGKLHTPAWCRNHSALLTTAIVLAVAQRTPGEAPVTYRLRRHVQFLRKEVYVKGYSSLEILQAYDLLALYTKSGDHVEDDRSNLPLAHACTIAYSVGLDKVGYTIDGAPSLTSERVYTDEEPERERRNYERAVIALFIWDRAFASVTGRPWLLPDGWLPVNVHTWHLHPLATPGDHMLLQHALLRQEISHIQITLRDEQRQNNDTSRIPQLCLELVSHRLHPWWARWRDHCRRGEPPAHEAHMSLIYHTAVVFALALALPFVRPNEAADKALIRAIQDAALDSCECLVLSADALAHMPFDLSVLVLYAALLALKLYTEHGSTEALPTLLGLLGQVARFLVETGASPPHRQHSTGIYGHTLRYALLAATSSLLVTPMPTRPQSPRAGGGITDDFLNSDLLASSLSALQPGGAGGDEYGVATAFSMPYMDQMLPLDWLAGAWPADVADLVSTWPRPFE